ncbi:hypothetical protein FACS1894208_09240 [Clostridia bacterium]|nr:hypothetical protein FACS1894208_09240 [Clostridia bacterium]
MNFGNWDWANPLMYGEDEESRLAKARLAATSPASVDVENQTAIFKGSGKNPYKTTLDKCTCVDFAQRKTPCKHIYRLALELELIDGDFQTGKNKNEFLTNKETRKYSDREIFSLPIDAQEVLYNLCVDVRYHSFSGGDLLLYREVSVPLITAGFLEELPPSFEKLSLPDIKDGIVSAGYTLGENGVPSRHSHKKTIDLWLSQNPEAIEKISAVMSFVKMSQRAMDWAAAIHRRITSRFEVSWIDTGGGAGYESVDKKFIKEA